MKLIGRARAKWRGLSCAVAAGAAIGSASGAACVGSDGASGADGGADSGGLVDSSNDALADSATLDAPTDAANETSTTDAGFTPGALGSALVVWLDSDHGLPSMGTSVSSWTDQSIGGHSAGQQAAANQPVVEPGINGHNAVKFDGTASYLTIADAADLNWGTGDFSVFVVAKYTNTPSANALTNSAYFWAKVNGSPSYAGVLFAGNTPVSVDVARSDLFAWVEFAPPIYVESTATGYNDGTFHVFGAKRTGLTSLEVRVDGARAGMSTITSVDVSSPTQVVYIGSYTGTQSFLAGDIAEVIAVNGALSTNDLSNVEAYLLTKYGL